MNIKDDLDEAIADTFSEMRPRSPGRPTLGGSRKVRIAITLSPETLAWAQRLTSFKYGRHEGFLSTYLEQLICDTYEADYQRRINDGEPVIED